LESATEPSAATPSFPTTNTEESSGDAVADDVLACWTSEVPEKANKSGYLAAKHATLVQLTTHRLLS